MRGDDIELDIPEGYADAFVHAQKVHPAPITEIFSMNLGGEDVPLYRIDFGNADEGEWLGVIRVETGDIPVTYTLYPFTEEQLEELEPETVDVYYSVMENFNIVLEAIYADPCFAADASVLAGEEYEAALQYWTVKLPGGMNCVETEENGVYKVVFNGRIQGENVALYAVSIGGESEAVPRMYSLNGEEKPLAVEVFDVVQNVFWSDEDCDATYQMQDTVNDVLELIMESERFLG